MKNLPDNVMSSLGLSGRSSRPAVDPVAAVKRSKDSKKDLKVKAYKAALLDLLYLQAVTGRIPGVTPAPAQLPVPPPMPPPMPMGASPMGAPPMGVPPGMPPEMLAAMAGQGAPPPGMMG